jgi:hypothetical protein
MKRIRTFLAMAACAALLATVGSVPVAQAEPPGSECVGDVDGDGRTGVMDLLAVIGAYGTECSNCPEDVTGDNIVGVDDLLTVVADFGCGAQVCGSHEDCADGDPCTLDICIYIKCLHIPIWGCDGD